MDDLDGLSELEQRLREDLRRVPAPLGFEARVMAAAYGRMHRRRWFSGRFAWGMAVFLMAVLGGGAVEYERISYERRAAVAQEEAGLALHIAAQKLDLVRRELNKPGDSR